MDGPEGYHSEGSLCGTLQRSNTFFFLFVEEDRVKAIFLETRRHYCHARRVLGGGGGADDLQDL